MMKMMMMMSILLAELLYLCTPAEYWPADILAAGQLQ